jgi:hypothetical protein
MVIGNERQVSGVGCQVSGVGCQAGVRQVSGRCRETGDRSQKSKTEGIPTGGRGGTTKIGQLEAGMWMKSHRAAIRLDL